MDNQQSRQLHCLLSTTYIPELLRSYPKEKKVLGPSKWARMGWFKRLVTSGCVL